MEYRMLNAGDENLLEATREGVFDHRVRKDLAAQFLSDPRHHIAVAIDGSAIVGFVTAVNYVHPDKPDELWINEVGVAEAYRRQGVAENLLNLVFEYGREHGCREAWVLTDEPNIPANRLYSKLGGIPQKPVMYSFRLVDDVTH